MTSMPLFCCVIDSWWQTIPRIYNTLSKKILPHTTGTSRFKQFICMSTSCGSSILITAFVACCTLYTSFSDCMVYKCILCSNGWTSDVNRESLQAPSWATQKTQENSRPILTEKILGL